MRRGGATPFPRLNSIILKSVVGGGYEMFGIWITQLREFDLVFVEDFISPRIGGAYDIKDSRIAKLLAAD